MIMQPAGWGDTVFEPGTALWQYGTVLLIQCKGTPIFYSWVRKLLPESEHTVQVYGGRENAMLRY